MSSRDSKPPERLPILNYSILKENVLRKKLRDFGIPDWGPRALLQRRHTEWMNLWNANCDAKVPKSKKDLYRELDVWERSQGGFAQTASGTQTGSASSVMRKDFDASAWSFSHDDDFKRLIENARKNAGVAKQSVTPQTEPAGESQETGTNVPKDLNGMNGSDSAQDMRNGEVDRLTPQTSESVVDQINPLGQENSSNQGQMTQGPVL
jgi:hypothetical protein